MILSQWTKLYWVRECPMTSHIVTFTGNIKPVVWFHFSRNMLGMTGKPRWKVHVWLPWSCILLCRKLSASAASSTVKHHPLSAGDDDLVGGLEHEWIIFHNNGNVIIPTEFHIFQRGWNHQPVMMMMTYVGGWSYFLRCLRFVDEAWWHKKKNASVYRLKMIYIYIHILLYIYISRSINNFE